MIKGKWRVFALLCAFSLLTVDTKASVLDNVEEHQLVTTQGYGCRSCDLGKVVNRVVDSYGLEDRQERIFREILEDVNYPIGRGRLKSGSSSCWNDLVSAVDECKESKKSEPQSFCEKVRDILTIKGLISTLQFCSEQELIDIRVRELTERIGSKDSASMSTLMSTRTRINWLIQDNEERKVEKLIGALTRHLMVCLPTPTEICFWKLKEKRIGNFPSNFRCFEESLDNFLLKMRYMIRNGKEASSKELMSWMDDFVEVYRLFPVSRKKIERRPENLLNDSISHLELSEHSHERFVLKEIGRAILAAQGPYESHRAKKPFIVIGGVNSDNLELIKSYLNSGLVWPVHAVSAGDLQDSEKAAVLGESWSWREIEGLKKVNKGWILDTLMETVKVGENEKEGPFLDNILLIENSDRFLDEERISNLGAIGKPLSSFIYNLVHENRKSIEVPYLGIEVSTEHLITIMVTEEECVLPGVSIIEVGDLVLSPSLVLSFSKPRQITMDMPSEEGRVRVRQNPSRIIFEESVPERSAGQSVSREEECMSIIRSFFEGQDKPDDWELDIYSEYLIKILSGSDEFCPEDFNCPSGRKFEKGKHNFFESESTDSLKELIYGYLQKQVSADDLGGASVF